MAEREESWPSLPRETLEGDSAAPEWPYPVDAFDVTVEEDFVPPAAAK